ncbi:MAG: hypothetical protein U0572_08355 [Phycisphaerales bacterium]
MQATQRVRPRHPIVSSVIALALAAPIAALAACSEESAPPPPRPASVPPQLALDPATKAALSDPKFAEFRKLVRELRAASKAMSQYLASIGGKPKSDAERSRYAELDAQISKCKQAVNEAMAASDRTPEERKTMRIIFALPESELGT